MTSYKVPFGRVDTDWQEVLRLVRQGVALPVPLSEPPRASAQPFPPVDFARVEYSAAYNSTANVPTVEGDGAPLPVGRVFAELLSVTTAGGSGALAVELVVARRGVRVFVRTADASAVVTGSVRLWTWNPDRRQWHLSTVEEALALHARPVSSDFEVVLGAP